MLAKKIKSSDLDDGSSQLSAMYGSASCAGQCPATNCPTNRCRPRRRTR